MDHEDRSVAAEILEKAAGLYESGELEWSNRLSVPPQACTIQAMAAAGREVTGKDVFLGDDFFAPACRAVMDRTGTTFIGMWNDMTPGLTQEKVVDVLKGAAKDLRNKEEEK